MSQSIRRKLFGSFIRLAFPAILLIVFAAVASSFWLVHRASAQPPRTAYLVTPEALAKFTQSGKKFTDETWSNAGDNTASRGWLARGKQGAPAVVLLHRYGADRSWLLNLGMQLNAETNFTVLIPDLRGHGEQPAVKTSSFGGCEADDLTGAIGFLKNLKTEQGSLLINSKIGVYGVEIGAVAAVYNAVNSPEIAALALDSVPPSPGAVLESVVSERASFASAAVSPLAGSAAPLYFATGCYKNTPLAETAQTLQNRKVLLLAGNDAPKWQASTEALASTLNASANVQKKTDLQPSGYNLLSVANSEQQTAYNKIVIDFFRNSLN